MGDAWYIQLNCAYCGRLNPNPEKVDDSSCTSNYLGINGIYYAPSSGTETFNCWSCGKTNKIVNKFIAEKI